MCKLCVSQGHSVAHSLIYTRRFTQESFLAFQWQEKGDVDVDIGANPSAEGGDDDAVDSNTQKVVDLIDAFRLNVGPTFPQVA